MLLSWWSDNVGRMGVKGLARWSDLLFDRSAVRGT